MKRLVIGVILLYQRTLSLDHGWLGKVVPHAGPVCRFDPTCSEYACQSINQHGVIRGGWLALKRVSRCHPWGGFGWDPVPEKLVK